MLTVYRSNRAEFLARLLSRQLIEQQPGPLETVEVMVNTWPTSRWLGEQLAMANGISSLVRFPFPGSRLRQLVRQVLQLPAQEDDPWRAGQLVWAVLELLPELLEQPVAQPLRLWLTQREGTASGLTRDRWQLARTIAMPWTITPSTVPINWSSGNGRGPMTTGSPCSGECWPNGFPGLPWPAGA